MYLFDGKKRKRREKFGRGESVFTSKWDGKISYCLPENRQPPSDPRESRKKSLSLGGIGGITPLVAQKASD